MNNDCLYLMGFAPLIQLWAGICLLFFYEGLLQESPFSTYRNKIKILYSNFTMKYLNFLPADKVIDGEEYVGVKWENFLPTIKNIASLSFFYSAFILTYIGIESHSQYTTYYQALQVTNVIIWMYLVASILFVKSKLFHRYTTSICLFIALVVYFHFYIPVNAFLCQYFIIGEYASRKTITVFTIFTCIGGVILILLRLLWDYWTLKRMEHSIMKIDKNFECMTQEYMGVAHNKLPQKLERKIKRKIWSKVKINHELSKNDFNNYLAEEIVEEFEKFTTNWLQKVHLRLLKDTIIIRWFHKIYHDIIKILHKIF